LLLQNQSLGQGNAEPVNSWRVMNDWALNPALYVVLPL